MNNYIIEARNEIKKYMAHNKVIEILTRLSYLTFDNVINIDLEDIGYYNLLMSEILMKDDDYCYIFTWNETKDFIKKCDPKNFEELVKVVGFILSNGAKDNAVIIAEKNNLLLNNIPSNVDDLIDFLIEHGLNQKMAIEIGNKVSLGKFNADDYPNIEEFIGKQYCEYLQNIRYFPKKNKVVKEVILGLFIAYFKCNYHDLFIAVNEDYDDWHH